MKKKLLYGIFFISIFLLSTASMVQPVHGYEFGVPDAAVGRSAESEITVFDEDEFEKALGKETSIKDCFVKGDVDEVGAKARSNYLEIEEKYDDDGIKWIKDHTFAATTKPASDAAQAAVESLYDPDVNGDYGPLMAIYNSSVYAAKNASYAFYGAGVQGVADYFSTATNTAWMSMYGINGGNGLTAAADAPGYNKRYDGTYLVRDYWYYTSDEYDEDDPDDEEYDIPFMADPRDWVAAWEALDTFKYIQNKDLDEMSTTWSGAAPGIGPTPTADQTTWYETLNSSVVGVVNSVYQPPTVPAGTNNSILAFMKKLGAIGYLVGANPWYHTNYAFGAYYFSSYIITATKNSINFKYPSKPGYLLLLLCSGTPVYVPQADYIAKIVDEFDIDDEALVKVPWIGTEIQPEDESADPINIEVKAHFDVYTEGVALIIDVEYEDETIDPADRGVVLPYGATALTPPVDIGGDEEDELEDFKFIFVYSDTGGQSSVKIEVDGEVIFEISAVSAIPGYEVHILLGASALTVIGLIFVIMKKRKM
jgi:hypothetical protein